MKRQDENYSGAYKGVLAAILGYLIWGSFPLYMHALADIPASEIITHRIIWSLPTALVIIFLMGGDYKWLKIFAEPHLVFCYLCTSLLIATNWLMYVWAINHGYGIEASLGYYIGPLINVVCGFFLFKERPYLAQWVGVFLAFIAVLLLAFTGVKAIWISVILALCLSFYGIFHRQLPLMATQGFMMEVILLFFPALFYIFYLIYNGQDHFMYATWSIQLLLICAGPLTTIPLILYAVAVKYLHFSTVGIIQYITPTCVFLLSYFVFHEKISEMNWIAYCLLWAGILIYMASAFYHRSLPKKLNS